MREKLYITFHSEDEIRHFVDTCNEFDDAIDIRIQKTAMDAKSLLGMLLMKTEEPLRLNTPATMMRIITKSSSRLFWKSMMRKSYLHRKNRLKIKLFEKIKKFY